MTFDGWLTLSWHILCSTIVSLWLDIDCFYNFTSCTDSLLQWESLGCIVLHEWSYQPVSQSAVNVYWLEGVIGSAVWLPGEQSWRWWANDPLCSCLLQQHNSYYRLFVVAFGQDKTCGHLVSCFDSSQLTAFPQSKARRASKTKVSVIPLYCCCLLPE